MTVTKDTKESGGATGSKAPPIGAFGMARWAWRQLTSMRTALLLLFLLALGSVPGSVISQRPVNPVEVMAFAEENPTLAEWYDRFGLFDVFGSVWFGAIYLLLLTSLLGCILPRTAQYLRTIRARPPAAPRRLDRMPEHRSWTTDGDATEVLAAAKETLRARRFRVVDDGSSIAAERGYLREVGNLVFHVALVVVLLGIAMGSLFGFQGTAVVTAGSGFANTVTQYDGYQSGRFFSEDQLPPFAFTVERFHAEFETEGEQRGSARLFDAVLSYTTEPGGQERKFNLRTNHPLRIDGSQIHLLGHGYAPKFTIRDGEGELAFSGAVPFLPQDGNFSSLGVVKVPDAAPTQLGLEGWFLPTAMVDPRRGPVSAFPDAAAPAVYLTAYQGDLGMDDGLSQSVYELEKQDLTQMKGKQDGEPFRVALRPGQSERLPGGAGTVRFDGYERWINVQMSRDPGMPVVLVGSVSALGGLLLSLVVRRRRTWIRVTEADERTVIEVAGLDKTEGGDLAAELDEISTRLRAGAAEPIAAEESRT